MTSPGWLRESTSTTWPKGCAAASFKWANDNAVHFETSKTEAILLSKKRKYRQSNKAIRVGNQTVRFAREATRWLGIWLDSSLSLAENRRRRIVKARQAKARLRMIVRTYGVPQASARTLQMAIIQGTKLYAFKLMWNGGKGVEGEYQVAIKRMDRATLGACRSTPLRMVVAESGLVSARALLNHHQSRFTQRLYARPRDGEGPEEILEREAGAALTARLRAAAFLQPGNMVERQERSRHLAFPGEIAIDSQAEALEITSRPDRRT